MTNHEWEPCTNGTLGKTRWFLLRVVAGKPEYPFDTRGYLRRWRTMNAASKVADTLNSFRDSNPDARSTNV